MQHIAIYDLDKTIVRTPTFTAFLMFAARQSQRSIWWRLPFWAIAMAGYALKLYGRKPLKQFGMRMFIGHKFTTKHADALARAFAGKIIPGDLLPGAVAAIKADRASGYTIVIATAAQHFYAVHIGHALGIETVLATQNSQAQTGEFSHKIEGENNYGAEKLRRVSSWLSAQGVTRAACHIRAYSDHISDAPLLDWADQAIFITALGTKAAIAQNRGWSVQDFHAA
jgi:phosphatidylglycerophosphatase C